MNYSSVLEELNDNATLPSGFIVSHLADYRRRHGRDDTAEANQGWILKSKGVDGPRTREMHFPYSPPWVHEKANPVRAGMRLERSMLGMGEVNGPFTVFSYRRIETPRRRARGPVVEELGRLDWADWDHDGSLLFARRGCLYRRALGNGEGQAKLVADLRDQAFAQVPPPAEARVWPRR